MKILHSDKHSLHAPAWYIADGRVLPCPEVPARADDLLHSLQSTNHQIILNPQIDPWPALRRTHSPDYLHYLQSIHKIWTAEFGNCDVLPDTFPRHRPATPPTKPSAQASYYCFDMAAPITAGTWDAALASATLAVAAADALLHGETSYALCRPPGHHAGRDYCGGFCYLNNIAIAAEHLLLRGGGGGGAMKRLAILDLDYHHGNGTQDIFYARPDVLFLSLHADPNTQYPYFWGYPQETGDGPGAGFNINLPLPRGTSETDWLQTLDTALHKIADFHPDALLISVGADISDSDPVGDFRLPLPAFSEIARRLRSLYLPTLFVQEGGYNVTTIGPCISTLLQAFSTE